MGCNEYTAPIGPCQPWARGKQGDGYGVLEIAGRKVLAHRHAYECAYGPIPPGLELDHLCGRRDCVNPDHLEPVTHLENVRRGQRAKVTPEMRAVIVGSDRDARALAPELGVHWSTVYRVRREAARVA